METDLKAGNTHKVCAHLADIAEGVLTIVETAAQASYLVGEHVPGCTRAVQGALDKYRLAR